MTAKLATRRNETQGSARRGRFEAAFHAHHDAVRRYAFRCGATDADDIVAESFVAFWRQLDSVTPEAERAWLFSTARGQCANQRRSARRRDRLRHALEADVGSATAHDQSSAATDPVVREALGCLSPVDQEILLLATWDGMSPSEIARVLAISRTAGAVRLHRARRRFRTEYLRRGDDLDNAKGMS
jgi:RNA polymerase sigma factor (sigma-70 family)